MTDGLLTSKRNWPVFVALAPLVCGVVVVLLPLSVIGMTIGIGIFGLLGIIGLVWSWLGSIVPRALGKKSMTRLVFLGCGCPAAVFGVIAFLDSLSKAGNGILTDPFGFLLAQWSVIFTCLAIFFIFSNAAFDARQLNSPKSLFGVIALIGFTWGISVLIVAIPYRINANYAIAREKTIREDNPEALLQKKMAKNAFATSICHDDLTNAAIALKVPHAVTSEDILDGVIVRCEWKSVSMLAESGEPDLSMQIRQRERDDLVLQAILAYESDRRIAQDQPCPDSHREFLEMAFREQDFDGIEMFASKGFSIRCNKIRAKSFDPTWDYLFWYGSKNSLTVNNIKRLLTVGLNLNDTDASGNYFYVRWFKVNSSEEVRQFLLAQGIQPSWGVE